VAAERIATLESSVAGVATNAMRIQSERLELIAATAESARAAADDDRTQLGSMLECEIATDWPPEFLNEAAGPLAEALAGDPQDRYTMWYVVLREPRTLIGTVGIKAPPKDGRVDIGYSIVASQQRRGYATEATRRLVELAFEDPRVDRVVAETLPDLGPSIRVMEKCGFRQCAANVTGFSGEEGVVRFELRRDGFGKAV